MGNKMRWQRDEIDFADFYPDKKIFYELSETDLKNLIAGRES